MSLCRTLCIAIAGLLLAACGDTADWREFSWPEGQFKVLMPGKPHREAREVTIGETKLAMQLFALRVDGRSYAVGYAPLPPGLDATARTQLAEAARDAFLRNLGAPNAHSKAVVVSGQPGWSFATSGEREGKSLAMAGRVVATEKNFYQAIFIGPAARAADAEVALFLESLVVGSNSAPTR